MRSPELASATARYLTFDARPSQASYVIPDHLAHADPLVERFEGWARRHLSDFSLAVAAKSVGTSERTLERRLRRVLGRSPLSYVQDLRVEKAVHLLQTTPASCCGGRRGGACGRSGERERGRAPRSRQLLRLGERAALAHGLGAPNA